MNCTSIALAAWLCGTPVVVDGDTIRLDTQTIRLWGIDAEELDEPNGQHARSRLKELLAGRVVRCNVLSIDKYGRHVGRCFVKDVEVNAVVVAQGLALDCRRYSGGTYASVEPVGIRSKLRQKPYCKT